VIGLWLPVAVSMIAIYYGALQPQVPSVIGERFTDTVLHAGGYAGLAMLTVRATSGGRWSGLTARALLLAFAIVVVHGVSVEVAQAFAPPRTAEWRDVRNDVAGAGAGLAAVWAWGIMRRKFS
jgi:VanZ family protein